MGAYSPAPVVTPALAERVMAEIIQPTVRAMAAEGHPFRGVLFAGLMIKDGAGGPEVKLLEFNVRFGDPECQVLMARLKSDLLATLLAACDGKLDSVTLDWHTDSALCVVMAARGYPGDYAKGGDIQGLEQAGAVDGVTVFHAATRRSDDGRLLATGGRVLGVTALGPDVATAQARAYRAVDQVRWADGFCRRDIGWRAIGRN
ncbi:phosphoribosylamine---glycine ligase [Azospirillaceae bacterium]